MIELLPLLLQGTWVTVKVTAFGSLLAIACALIAALARLSPLPPLRWLAAIYVEVFRGSSLLVQLFWLYFVLPLPPFNVEMSAFAVAVVGLGLNIGAYGAEVLRGAIRSVHRGEGWTPQTIAEHGMPALKGSFYKLDRSADIFSWDPV